MESTFVVKRCTKCGRMFRLGFTGIGHADGRPDECDTCAQVARSTQGDAIEPGEPFYEPIKARQDQRKGRAKWNR